jgi:hypothetical protein
MYSISATSRVRVSVRRPECAYYNLSRIDMDSLLYERTYRVEDSKVGEVCCNVKLSSTSGRGSSTTDKIQVPSRSLLSVISACSYLSCNIIRLFRRVWRLALPMYRP